MLSEQLLNVMRMFSEPSIYQDFTTSIEITNAVNQLSLGCLNSNREKYVISCLINAVQEALGSSMRKVSDPKIKSELTTLGDELMQFQLALLSEEKVKH